ncbi:hypothetical protein [Rodentibacter pneumotropicus]|uniref:Uncharacterized protein n=1 Tax=Rodentibacter pneumotropicus TaxID=758 RepID=A0A4S2QHZ9_9PAST|nr:hypothetical protein [Rodentibacter pneumotropicus]THA16820.1 hypothetical protein D3M76_02775 [Rodentibacter pneumotropicus]
MLSEKEIEALKAGAYGVTRDGRKVKYLGKVSSNTNGWITFNKLNEIQDVFLQYSTFASYFNKKEHDLDIVGLWENKPEPFDLERAMAGEMIVENNFHYWLVAQSRSNKDEYILEDLEGNTTTCRLDELYNKFKMWKEPEPVKPSADDLPKPIREVGDLSKVWKIGSENGVYKPQSLNKSVNWFPSERAMIENGCCFATREDCQIVCNWLMNR